ncbi:cytochrome c4 [Shimia sp. CNT1-13L.2]|uniref:c-type cytochrome n=1 Tax=Shimia sp. CNT1-13L.2 TaxID=2959663 RepID=UPI0020CBD97B|nr:c-type cytochrome [Shimia sp. CNT1-13L.2]MCP9481467.1 cytochrome c4 [Shimia sp. CNT1-13L.2]
MRKTALLLSAILFAAGAQAEEGEPIATVIEDRCSHCHGDDGQASSRFYPRLAAQNRVYLAKQLRNFRDGSRASDVMNDMAVDLSDAQIEALAAFFSTQPVKAHRVRTSKKSLEAVGAYIYHEGNEYTQIPPCSDCHGETAAGDEVLPRLAGQHRHYMVEQLQAFGERTRTNDNAIMHSIASKLTELEINAVSLYVSGLKD